MLNCSVLRFDICEMSPRDVLEKNEAVADWTSSLIRHPTHFITWSDFSLHNRADD